MSETCRGHLWDKIIIKLFASSWYTFLTYIYDARSHLYQIIHEHQHFWKHAATIFRIKMLGRIFYSEFYPTQLLPWWPLSRFTYHDLHLTKRRLFIIKANEMHCFSALFGKELYMFRTDLLSIIRSLNTVFIAIGICHTSYVDCLPARSGSILTSLADGNITSVTNTYCSEYSTKTPDDGQ